MEKNDTRPKSGAMNKKSTQELREAQERGLRKSILTKQNQTNRADTKLKRF